MNKFRKILRYLYAAAVTVPGAVAVSSCDSLIYEDLEPCAAEVRFMYDYNMEYTDIFAKKVDCITLLIYKDGELIDHRVDDSENLSFDDYAMRLELPAGDYRLVAYGGLEYSNPSFSFDTDPWTIPHDLRTVSLQNLTSERVSKQYLRPLYYGSTSIRITPYDKDQVTRTYGIRMIKNTNDFRIILQHLNNKPVYAGDFQFEIYDDNTDFRHDNKLSPSRCVTYNPWISGESNVGWNTAGEDNIVAYFELSTSRLIHQRPTGSKAADSETSVFTTGYEYDGYESDYSPTELTEYSPSGQSRAFPNPIIEGIEPGSTNVKSPRLKITHTETGRTVADIPIIDYLLLYKSEANHSKMSNQEFLDRESEWNMIFFLDENDMWAQTQIIVNNWVVRLNDTDF